MMYSGMNRPDKAEPMLLRVIKLREAKLGADHPDVAVSLNHLADVYQMLGQPGKAEPMYRRSLKIFEAKLGPNDLKIANYSLHNLAMLHASAGRFEEAAAEFDRSRRIARSFVSHSLFLMDEMDQQRFLATIDALDSQTALSIGVVRHGDPKIAALAESWLVNGKCVGQASLALHNSIAQSASKNPQVAARSPNCANREAPRMNRYGSNLLPTLPRQLPTTRNSSIPGSSWPTWRNGIDRGSAMVDIARFAVWDFGRDGKHPHAGGDAYVAWIIPASEQGQIESVDLGPVGTIRRRRAGRARGFWITSARRSMRSSPTETLKQRPIIRKDRRCVVSIWTPVPAAMPPRPCNRSRS